MHNFYSLNFTMIQHIIIKHSVSNSFKKTISKNGKEILKK